MRSEAKLHKEFNKGIERESNNLIKAKEINDAAGIELAAKKLQNLEKGLDVLHSYFMK